MTTLGRRLDAGPVYLVLSWTGVLSLFHSPQETVRFAVLSMWQYLPWSTDSLDGEVRSPLRRDSVLEGEGVQVP